MNPASSLDQGRRVTTSSERDTANRLAHDQETSAKVLDRHPRIAIIAGCIPASHHFDGDPQRYDLIDRLNLSPFQRD